LLLLACSKPPETVIFVVLDTVRADRLSACGYGDTSPNLAALDGSLSCTAVAPGSWTLPSHASFMTGAMPVDHRAHCITSGVDDLGGSGARSRPLNQDLGTLAEAFVERGYQTIAVSGNPVVSEKMGLLRGFESTHVAPAWGSWFGDTLPEKVSEAMSPTDPARSTFLFVNIADAHQPWRGQGESLTWNKKKDEGDWARYHRGEMSAEEWAPLQAKVDRLYDAAVTRADTSLGQILSQHCGDNCRVVITSDHGEMLGEHGLLDHGHNVWDENAVVPLYTSQGEIGEGWVSALDAHGLVLGEPKRHAPVSEAWPHVRRCARTAGAAFCSVEVGVWGETKTVWSDGEEFVEAEGVRTPVTVWTLTEHGTRLRREARDDGQIDFEVEELLRAAGYMD